MYCTTPTDKWHLIWQYTEGSQHSQYIGTSFVFACFLRKSDRPDSNLMTTFLIDLTICVTICFSVVVKS